VRQPHQKPKLRRILRHFSRSPAGSCEEFELKIEYVEEVGWGTMIESLQTKRIDIVCAPIWPNAQRAKVADFVEPLYYTQSALM